jgi:trimeric autotransporter adhesin
VVVSGNLGAVTLALSGNVHNSGTVETLGSSGTVLIEGDATIFNSGKGVLLASGGGQIVLSEGTIIGGTVGAVGGGAAIVVSGNLNTILTAAIAGSSLVEVVSSGSLLLVGGSIGSGATVELLSGGSATMGAVIAASGGTVFASGASSFLQLTSGTVIKGGIVEVGDGIVDVLSGGTANVAFFSAGTGGLEIADSPGNTSAFTGTVSGFGVGSGGTAHGNTNQFIDLVSVTSAPNTISASYVSAASHTSGTLFVSSGGTQVAAIEMIGSYATSNFVITAGSGGTVAITDPTVVNGGSVEPGAATAFPQPGIDLPDIAFGAQTTLAYAENSADTGGTLTVTDGRHAASIALLGNCMAGSFATAADGHGGTLVTEASQAAQPLLARPHP